MTKPSYKGVFNDWEIAVAKSVIEKCRRGSVLKIEEFDDLLQECLMHWCFVKDRYNPAKGASRQTFMARIVENKLLHINDKLTSHKRDILKTVSLDQPISIEEDSPSLLEVIPDNKPCVSNLRITVGIKIDVSNTLQKLNPKQQKLCRLLGEEGLNIKKDSESLKIPRSTLYGEIKRIRRMFEKSGLRIYLDEK